ncbi:MAG: feruloyl-CoA synthase [Xanthobacteraceae bacterium]|nr:MAG: feruloyl-CoA synthase [Xanthobacteraceae bacterium]
MVTISAPLREIAIGPCDVEMTERADGVIYVKSLVPLGAFPGRLTERLEHWAVVAPERIFLAERDGRDGWRTLTYGQTLPLARRVAVGLLAHNASPERPVAVLSGNGIDHAVIALAAYFAGVPYAPVSPGYSTIPGGLSKLRYVLDLLTPGLVYARDGGLVTDAVRGLIPRDAALVMSRAVPALPCASSFADLAAVADDEAVERAYARVGPDTIAKILFTSGSTGVPKGVIQTHRMLCANQTMVAAIFAFLAAEPPVAVDWLPWHHTAGGNNNLGSVLFHGGSLYIDDGRPAPGEIDKTIRNLRDIPATVNYGVPKSWADLIPHLRADKGLRETFFRRLRLMFYAGASLPQHVLDALNELAVESCGERVAVMTGLGATETGPSALCCTREVTRAGIVGLPLPGVTLKLVPKAGKLEARIKSPSLTPGYWRQPALTQQAFDAEGFYRLGDALRFADPGDVRGGFIFDGRIVEDFKLLSGTWVNVGSLRPQLLTHFAPLFADVVITGGDRAEVGALVFPSLERCREAAALPLGAPAADVLSHPNLRARIARRLDEFARAATGSSNRVTRLLLLRDPPSFGDGEITDKGSINSRAVLERRAASVEALYSATPGAEVIVVGSGEKAWN